MPQAIRQEFRQDLEKMHIDDFLKVNPKDVARRAKAVGVVYWQPNDSMPIDLFSIIREAPYCFFSARFIAAISLASSAVELILNKDTRTRGLPMRRVQGWATLNNENLAVAQGAGLPVGVLVDGGESPQQNAIRFVTRRNKIAHGDIAGLVKTLSDYDPGAEAEALDQVLKGQRFVIEWFNTAPDVQQERIRNHQWVP